MPPTDWRESRVLVTGATGLVGSWLVERLLAAGATVSALVRDWDPQSRLIRSGTVDRIAVISGELEDFRTVERAVVATDSDTVFHLGAQTIVGAAQRSPLATMEANIQGTFNVLEACRTGSSRVARVVVASSDKAYGENTRLPYTEDMPLCGRHPYDVSKSCTDLLAQSYHHSYGLPVAIARCGNIYGGGDFNWSRIVPGTIRSVLLGERPVVRSDGKFRRDYVYVQDVVDGFLALAEAMRDKSLSGQAFNFSSQRPRTVLEIVDCLRGLMARKDLEPIILDNARGEIRDQYLSSEKAAKVLGWKAKHELEEGLRKTIPWYEKLLKGGNADSG